MIYHQRISTDAHLGGSTEGCAKPSVGRENSILSSPIMKQGDVLCVERVEAVSPVAFQSHRHYMIVNDMKLSLSSFCVNTWCCGG